MKTGRYDGPRRWRKSAGPWDTEPDWAVFDDQGYSCHVLRHEDYGHFCGYVTLPRGHVFWRDWGDDDSVIHFAVEVHGGVTYDHSGEQSLPDGSKVAGLTIGFDCNHSRDIAPYDTSDWNGLKAGSVYRTFEYVLSETRDLAYQLSVYKPLEQLISGTDHAIGRKE